MCGCVFVHVCMSLVFWRRGQKTVFRVLTPHSTINRERERERGGGGGGRNCEAAELMEKKRERKRERERDIWADLV